MSSTIPTEVLLILNHLPVQLTFTKLTTKCYQNRALPRLKKSEKMTMARKRQNYREISTKGASLLFFLLPVVTSASSPSSRVSRSPLTKMRNEAPEEEAVTSIFGNENETKLFFSKHSVKQKARKVLFGFSSAFSRKDII